MVCLSYNGDILATGFITGGSVDLEFAGITGSGSILVTISGFNTIPYQGWVELVPADGPYLVGNNNTIDDQAGNNNGQADYSEDLLIDAAAHNIGVETAPGVSAIITTTNSAINITDNTHFYGDIAAGDTIAGDDAFAFVVTGYIEDQAIVTFTITFTDSDGNTWTSNYNVVINAPAFACENTFTIDDDGNGRLDSGETATITVPVTNTGHAATAVAVTATLADNSSYVTITDPSVSVGIIEPGATANAVFTVSVAPGTPDAEPVSFDFATASDYYGAECGYDRTINQVIEDWESGTTTSYPWQFADDADWFLTSDVVYEGEYSMHSGTVSHGEQTTLKLTLDFQEAGDITFAYKTSSEESYDFLKFRIDGTTMGQWSGENDWTEISYPVTAGVHILRWIYVKDNVASDGEDAAWVDNIIFPPNMPVAVDEKDIPTAAMTVYPNPADEFTLIGISGSGAGSASVSVENLLGEIIYTVDQLNLNNGSNNIRLETATWPAGVYMVSVKTPAGIFTRQLVKR
jgi:hypothetical protein